MAAGLTVLAIECIFIFIINVAYKVSQWRMNIFRTIKHNKFYRTRINNVDAQNLSLADISEKLLLMTVTYNNSNVVRQQIRFVKKNIKDDFNYIIADNSTDKNTRHEIAALCKKNQVGYISLPKNPYTTGSNSHAIALNWLYKNLVCVYKPAYFGFLDHDIYPIKSQNVLELIGSQSFYGVLQERDECWYIWPGFCFFQREIFTDIDVNFMPGKNAGIAYDTGGALYHSLYKNYPKNALRFPAQVYENIREGEIFQSDKIERFDGWLHSFNGSYWMQVPNKEEVLNKVLDDYYSQL